MISVPLTVQVVDDSPRAMISKAQQVGSWLEARGLQFLVDYEWASVVQNGQSV